MTAALGEPGIRSRASRLGVDKRPVRDRRVDVCGVGIDALTKRDVIAIIEARLDEPTGLSISVVNVAKLVAMRNDRLLRESVLSGDLILADGMPLVWLARVLRRPLPERVAGIDLMFELLRLADRRGLRVFFLGAKPDVLQQTVAVARQEYPGLVLAGSHHGYFADADGDNIAGLIRRSRPDILLVAMSSPKKELFLSRYGPGLAAGVCHGVGGSFDVMAGVTRRAPRWMQSIGMEWFYRLLQEPRRMWRRYLTTNLLFFFMAAREILCARVKAGNGNESGAA